MSFAFEKTLRISLCQFQAFSSPRLGNSMSNGLRKFGILTNNGYHKITVANFII